MPNGDGGKYALSALDLDNLGIKKAQALGLSEQVTELQISITSMKAKRDTLVRSYQDCMFSYETLVSSIVSARGLEPNTHGIDFERGMIVPTLAGVFDPPEEEQTTVPPEDDMDRRRGACVTAGAPRGGMEAAERSGDDEA